MHWRQKIGRAAGVDVFVHWSYWLGPLYIVLLHWTANMSWPLVGILLVLLFALSACVLLHEFGHSLAARHFGVETKDIILTPIGGFARLIRFPNDPLHEFAIALAGPAANLVVALVFAGIVFGAGDGLGIDLSARNIWQFPKLMCWMNLCLFAFNLIPAFPMDGGRILRSLLAMQLSRSKATLAAGVTGQLIALLFVGFGLYTSTFPFTLIGILVFLTASFEVANAWPSIGQDQDNQETGR